MKQKNILRYKRRIIPPGFVPYAFPEVQADPLYAFEALFRTMPPHRIIEGLQCDLMILQKHQPPGVYHSSFKQEEVYTYLICLVEAAWLIHYQNQARFAHRPHAH